MKTGCPLAAICIALPNGSVKDIHTGNVSIGEEGTRIHKDDIVFQENGGSVIRKKIECGGVSNDDDGRTVLIFVKFTADPEKVVLCLFFQRDTGF